jgi:hypothetical protein
VTTWKLTAENTTAVALSALRESDSRVPAFPADGRRDEHTYYHGDEADYGIVIAGDDPQPPGYAPLWMYEARELLEQYGIRSHVYAGDDIDSAMRSTGTHADSALRSAESRALVDDVAKDNMRPEDDLDASGRPGAATP